MIKSTKIDLYDWHFDIVPELCRIMESSEDRFRDYHELVGGEYKDFWHVCIETIVPDNMCNDSIVRMYSANEKWYEADDEKWKNKVLQAWNTLYLANINEQDNGMYVEFSW